jgi:hypothetical protein
MKPQIIYSAEEKTIKIDFGNNKFGYAGDVAIEIARHLKENEAPTIETIKKVAQDFILNTKKL